MAISNYDRVGKALELLKGGRIKAAYLYALCERKKRAAEALSYNALVQSWPEITRLAQEGGKPRPVQGGLFDGGEE